MRKVFRLSAYIGGVLLLTSCSSEPSEKNMREALDKQLQSQVDGMQQMLGKEAVQSSKALLPEIKSLKKIGCKPDGNNAFNCDVELEVSQLGGSSKSATSIRFVKSSDGWMAIK